MSSFEIKLNRSRLNGNKNMLQAIKPPKLENNDNVGVISPSMPVFSKKALNRGLKIIESLGYKPRLGPKALAVHANYQAGTISDRIEDFKTMFLDDSIKAIFCTGGGYSSIQLLPEIDWEMIIKNPKIFIGYSDITALLMAITEKTGLVTFHGLMMGSLGDETRGAKFTQKNLKEALSKGEKRKLPAYTEWKTLKAGRAEGILIGGNLTTLLSLMGTPYEPKWDNKILFWEEAYTTLEEIDNSLWRLRLARVFKKIEGMVIGKITDLQSIEDEDGGLANLEKPPSLESIILNATEGYNFPLLYGVDFGHDVPNLTLPLGVKTSLNCPQTNRLGDFSILENYLS